MIETLTPHAKLRMKQRTCNSKRQLQLALERGKNISEYGGKFRRYLDYLRITHKCGLIIYDNNIFAYSIGQKKLLTVLKIPSRYLKYL